MAGERYSTTLDEQIVYNQLDGSEHAVWSLLLASGYLRVASVSEYSHDGLSEPVYELELTNLEVKYMFQSMVRSWFGVTGSDYNDFVKALLLGDVDAMNEYMNRVALDTFSFFDTGKRLSARTEPERFYHGFVLGLIVELQGKYVITSNRESGFGRYDIMMEPVSPLDDAIIIEFKVYNARREADIEETLRNALLQVETKDYASVLLAKGISAERIRKHGFAFEGKNVLIG